MTEPTTRPQGSDPTSEPGERQAESARPPRRHRTAVIAAVVAVLVLGAGLAFALTRHSGSVRVATSPPTTQSNSTATASTSATTSTTAAPPLARGVEAPRSAIPWSQVGPGWTIATWGPTPGVAPGEQPPAGTPGPEHETTKVFLVNPIGGRYLVTTLAPPASWQIADWSPDGRRALLLQRATGGTVDQLDLTTGAVHKVASEPSLLRASYSQPAGRAVLVGRDVPATGDALRPALVRLGLDGTQQQSYPMDFPKVGQYDGSWLSTPDGTQLVMGARKGMAVVGNGGTIIRELTVPGGAGCSPVRWWDGGVVLATCSSSASPQLWLVPLSGAPPTVLTRPSGDDLGDIDAWRIPSGTFAQSLGGCGSEFLSRVGANGTTTRVAVPGIDPTKTIVVIGSHDDQLLLQATADCGGGQSLLWFSPSANTTTVVLGPPLNGGGVRDGVLYPGPLG